MSVIGQAMDRTDGRLKVTGGATFSAEHAVPRLAQAVMVTSTIANGRITHIDTRAAQTMRGVRAVMTYQNAPALPKQEAPPPGAQANPKLTLLQDNLIHYNGQPIAVVVADTLEHARDAASHVRVRYAKESAQLDFAQAKRKLRKPVAVNGKAPDSSRGNALPTWCGRPRALRRPASARAYGQRRQGPGAPRARRHFRCRAPRPPTPARRRSLPGRAPLNSGRAARTARPASRRR